MVLSGFKNENNGMKEVIHTYQWHGDIIFFDWKHDGQDGKADHVGIVERIDLDTRTIHTIEGNSSDSCKEKTYSFDDTEVLGFGNPKY